MTFPAPDRNWILPDWPAPAGVRTLITTRAGGVSQGPYASLNLGQRVGDEPAAVVENRARLARFLPAEPVWLAQVHGNGVVSVSGTMEKPAGDAAVTREPAIVLALQTADCLPVLFCDRAGTVVGAAHAGWRGLNAGVIENTVRAMGRPGEDLLAYLGPAIGPDNFEVGDEVRSAFIANDPLADQYFRPADRHFRPEARGKWLADLYGLARQRLARVNVNDVYGGGYCTVAEAERFFSHRRDGVTGRMAALIWRT